MPWMNSRNLTNVDHKRLAHDGIRPYASATISGMHAQQPILGSRFLREYWAFLQPCFDPLADRVRPIYRVAYFVSQERTVFRGAQPIAGKADHGEVAKLAFLRLSSPDRRLASWCPGSASSLSVCHTAGERRASITVSRAQSVAKVLCESIESCIVPTNSIPIAFDTHPVCCFGSCTDTRDAATETR